MILNRLKGNLKIACVKAPAFGDNRKNQLEDIAILTNSTVIDSEVGLTFENCELDVLGSAKKVIITKEDTTIIDGTGDGETITRRIEQINTLKENSESEYDKEKLEERASKLSGGVGCIKVGGGSEVEVKEIKDRIVDAIQATRCALDEGIVIGGGTALLYASQTLSEISGANFDQQQGIDIVKRALQMPCKTI